MIVGSLSAEMRIDTLKSVHGEMCINGSDGEAYPGTAWSISERIFDWLTPAIKSAGLNNSQNTLSTNYKELEGLYGNIWNESSVIFLDGKLQIVNPNTADPQERCMDS